MDFNISTISPEHVANMFNLKIPPRHLSLQKAGGASTRVPTLVPIHPDNLVPGASYRIPPLSPSEREKIKPQKMQPPQTQRRDAASSPNSNIKKADFQLPVSNPCKEENLACITPKEKACQNNDVPNIHETDVQSAKKGASDHPPITEEALISNAAAACWALKWEDVIASIKALRDCPGHHDLIAVLRTPASQGNFLVARDNAGVVYLAVGGPDALDPNTSKHLDQLRSAKDGNTAETALFDRVANIPVEHIYEALEPRLLVVCGHSVNGCVAMHLALWMARHSSLVTKLKCITFGALLVGNAKLKETCDSLRISDNMIHIVHKNDAVPRAFATSQGLKRTGLHSMPDLRGCLELILPFAFETAGIARGSVVKEAMRALWRQPEDRLLYSFIGNFKLMEVNGQLTDLIGVDDVKSHFTRSIPSISVENIRNAHSMLQYVKTNGIERPKPVESFRELLPEITSGKLITDGVNHKRILKVAVEGKCLIHPLRMQIFVEGKKIECNVTKDCNGILYGTWGDTEEIAVPMAGQTFQVKVKTYFGVVRVEMGQEDVNVPGGKGQFIMNEKLSVVLKRGLWSLNLGEKRDEFLLGYLTEILQLAGKSSELPNLKGHLNRATNEDSAKVLERVCAAIPKTEDLIAKDMAAEWLKTTGRFLLDQSTAFIFLSGPMLQQLFSTEQHYIMAGTAFVVNALKKRWSDGTPENPGFVFGPDEHYHLLLKLFFEQLQEGIRKQIKDIQTKLAKTKTSPSGEAQKLQRCVKKKEAVLETFRYASDCRDLVITEKAVCAFHQAIVVTNKGDTVWYGGCPLFSQDSESMENISRWLRFVHVTHELRKLLSVRLRIGLAGDQNAGKTTLLNMLWGSMEEVGDEEHTDTTVHEVSPRLWVVDFSGTSSPNEKKSHFSDRGTLTGMIVLVVPYTGDVDSNLGELVKDAENVLQKEELESKLLVCINRCQSRLNRKEVLGMKVQFGYSRQQKYADFLNTQLTSSKLRPDQILFTDWFIDDEDEIPRDESVALRQMGVVGVEEVRARMAKYLRDVGRFSQEEVDQALRRDALKKST